MRINVLQHTPNEGPGTIADWSKKNGHAMTVYHPAHFNGVLPKAEETDFLIVLGSPKSPNDSDDYIQDERLLIADMLAAGKPILGICYGAQQIVKLLGYPITKAAHKEVGWAPVYRKSNRIPGLPDRMTVLHWHEEQFAIPKEAELLFSSDLVTNQGFVMGNVVGLQFHFEPDADSVREIVVNDSQYAVGQNDLHQTKEAILDHGVPNENAEVLAKILDYQVQQSVKPRGTKGGKQ